MKLPITISVALIAVTLCSCRKNKFTTIPQLTIKSISPKTVFNSNIISLKGKFTDQEGDLDSIYIVYKWYNNTIVVRNDTFRYPTSRLKLPSKTREGDIFVTFEYNTNNNPNLVPLPGASARDTTATLGLIIVDKASHRSNYGESEQIRLKKP